MYWLWGVNMRVTAASPQSKEVRLRFSSGDACAAPLRVRVGAQRCSGVGVGRRFRYEASVAWGALHSQRETPSPPSRTRKNASANMRNSARGTDLMKCDQ